MDGTILSQGTFTVPSFGPVSTNIVIPSNADFMHVYNYTQAGNALIPQYSGVNFYWQLGMAPGTGMVWYNATADSGALSIDTLSTDGFTLYNSSVIVPGAAVALTDITAANPPVITTTNAPPVGSIVRIINPNNQPQIGGIDFTVTSSNLTTTFDIGNASLSNSTASTTGFWRLIPFDPIFYPRRRYITWIRSASQTVIYLSVTHEFAVGQSIRLSFPGQTNVWGSFGNLDGVNATITAVNVARVGNEPNNGGTANNIQLNIDTSAFGAWSSFGAGQNENYPAASQVPFGPAAVVPIGEDSSVSLTTALPQAPLDYYGNLVAGTQPGLLSDATQNLSTYGMTLGIGGLGRALGSAITGPAGTAVGDVMYWVAGKSVFGGQ